MSPDHPVAAAPAVNGTRRVSLDVYLALAIIGLLFEFYEWRTRPPEMNTWRQLSTPALLGSMVCSNLAMRAAGRMTTHRTLSALTILLLLFAGVIMVARHL